MSTRIVTAVVHREESLYVAQCPEIGTVSQGASLDEAVAGLREATELYLKEFPLENRGTPIVTFFEVSCG